MAPRRFDCHKNYLRIVGNVGSNSGKMTLQEYVELMKGGDCKEAYTAVEDYRKEAKENRSGDKYMKVLTPLEKCVEAHSDYHQRVQPLFAARKEVREELSAAFTARQRDYAGKGDAVSEKELRKQFPEFLRGGGCKELFTAYMDCVKEGNSDDKCGEQRSKMSKCMVAHHDYYFGVGVCEAIKEKYVKANKAFFL